VSADGPGTVAARAGALALVLAIAAPVAAEPLRIGVAVSLLQPVTDAVERFRAERPGVEVEISSGASGVLVRQALRGAPFDVLISAAPYEIDRLVEAGLASGEQRRRVAANRLAVVGSCAGTLPRDLNDLGRPEFDRIAIANPRTAPVGRYARQALERIALWESLEPRLVYGESARQVVAYVARREVPAAIVYVTDVMLHAGRVCAGATIDPRLHDPILYEGVVLTAGGDGASRLLDSLASPAMHPILERYGFVPAPR